MSTQQLAGILEYAAHNPPPPNPTPAMMRDYVEAAISQLPGAEGMRIERVSGGFEGELILPTGRDATRLIIFYHGGCFFFGSSRTAFAIRSCACSSFTPRSASM